MIDRNRPYRVERRRPVAPVIVIVFSLLCILAISGNAWSQPDAIEIRSRCADCHLNPDPPPGTAAGPLINADEFHASVHGKQRCEGCHRTIVEIPHEKTLPPVDCRVCHRLENRAGAPELRSYREYEESVHGILTKEGDERAPRCQNCHGDHDVLVPEETSSHVNKLHIAATCGQCHPEIRERYAESVHGRALAEGNLEAPVCTDCHGEHFILRPSEKESNVSRDEVVNTCAICHEDIVKMKMFGITEETVESYRESYHGVAYKLGSGATATCTQCHGYHEVFEREDERSTIHAANLPTTCGQSNCHEGAGEGFALGKVHVSFHEAGESYVHEGRDHTVAKVFHVVELAFIGLTTVVIFGMIIYMALDLHDRWVRRGGRWFRYIAVVTIPLILTFWGVWKATIVFVSKLHL